MKLDYFENPDNFYFGLQSLFKSLNVPVNYIDEKSLKPQDILSKTYEEGRTAIVDYHFIKAFMELYHEYDEIILKQCVEEMEGV